MINLKINEKAINNPFILSFVKNKTWGHTVNIKELTGAKKIAYAGGLGYCKVSAVLRDFVNEILLKDEISDNKKEILREIDTGEIAFFGDINIEDFKEFFKTKLNLKVNCNWNNKKDIFIFTFYYN